MFVAQRPLPGYTAPKVYERLQVHGKNASEYEYNVAVALDYYKLDYIFQADHWGGRRFRGGFVVDFLVFTLPFPTPVWVNGEYWHKGKQATVDFLQRAIIGSFFSVAQPVVFWGKDVDTIEKAMDAVKKEFRR